jgi:hypothetical protein
MATIFGIKIMCFFKKTEDKERFKSESTKKIASNTERTIVEFTIISEALTDHPNPRKFVNKNWLTKCTITKTKALKVA